MCGGVDGFDYKTFRSRTFPLYTNPDKRAEKVEELMEFIKLLPDDKLFRVTLRKGQETRLDVANRLYQVCIGSVVDQHSQFDDPQVVAGRSKFHLLLPRKKIWAAQTEDEELAEQADFEIDLCDAIASSAQFDWDWTDSQEEIQHAQDNLYRAYNSAIRSKTLKTTPFSWYVNLFIDHWATQGVTFELPPSERDRALADEWERRAA